MEQTSALGSFVRRNRGLVVVVLLLIALLIFGSFYSDRFRTTSNILNVFEQSTGLALVSLGQTLTILTGGIDMSVGSMISLLSLLTSGLIDGKANLVVPVAAGILYPLTGIVISPIWASAAMTFSSVSVIANALRLRRVDI